jgi:hypothetical protein
MDAITRHRLLKAAPVATLLGATGVVATLAPSSETGEEKIRRLLRELEDVMVQEFDLPDEAIEVRAGRIAGLILRVNVL